MRRVVVTGMGAITPFGVGVERSWQKLLAGESGVRRIESFDTSDLPSKIAGQVPRGAAADGAFDPEAYLPAKERRRIDEFILFAIAATREAVADAGLTTKDEAELERSGVLVGSGIGGLPSIAENAIKLHEQGPRRISPFFIPGSIINEASGLIAIEHGFKGPNHAVVTACATGAHAIGETAFLGVGGDVGCDQHRTVGDLERGGCCARGLGKYRFDRRVRSLQRNRELRHLGGDVVDAFAQQRVFHPLRGPARFGFALHCGEFALQLGPFAIGPLELLL